MGILSGSHIFNGVRIALNFISGTQNFYITFRLKKTQTVLFLVSLTPLKLMTSSKVHKNVTHWKTFFSKLSSHRHVVLLLPYTTQLFFSTACTTKKSFTPFSETSVNFQNFFTVVYVLTGATNDPGLRVPRFAVWGWGQKQIFDTGEKLFLSLQKNQKIQFSYKLSCARGSSPT